MSAPDALGHHLAESVGRYSILRQIERISRHDNSSAEAWVHKVKGVGSS